MLKQDALLLVSIFCYVDDFCKDFEPEWRKFDNHPLFFDSRKQVYIRPIEKASEQTEMILYVFRFVMKI